MDVRMVGEGGVEWEFDLPLHETIADQVKQGKLTPKTEDDRAALAYLFEAGAEEPVAEEPRAELTLADRINATTSHADANALAAELGVEGFEEKKPTMDVKRAALHAKAQEMEQGQ